MSARTRMRGTRRWLGAVALVSLLAGAAPAATAPEPKGRTASLLERAGASVVAVRFRLEPRERPIGVQGRNDERIMCGLFAGPPGQVVVSGDFFPDLDEGSTALDPVDFRLELPDGTEVPADPIGIDRELNLAFLQADPDELPGVRGVSFTKGANASLGEPVFVVGVLPEEYGFAPAVYGARISAVIDKPRRMYALDLTAQNLSIGGLVLLADGRPLGILAEDVIAGFTPSADNYNLLSLFGSMNQGRRVGYPMVFPYEAFERSLGDPPKLAEETLESRGWLGVVMQPLSRDLADYWEISGPGGVIVTAVIEGSPAASAGLEAGDVILEVDGETLAVRDPSDLTLMQKRIRNAGAGRAVPLGIWRQGQRGSLDVRLTSAPVTATLARDYENEVFGLRIRELTFDYLQNVNLDRATRGVLVVDLERAGWAEVSGLRSQDIIRRVDDEATHDVESFRTALERAEEDGRPEVILFVLRNYQTRFVRIKTDFRGR